MSIDEEKLRGLARPLHAGWQADKVAAVLAGVPGRRRALARARALAVTTIAVGGAALALVVTLAVRRAHRSAPPAATPAATVDRPATIPAGRRPRTVWPAVPARAGRFSIDGSRLLGPDGAPFVAKGVNVNGPNWVWPHDVTADAAAIADVWRFNLVRVLMMAVPHPTTWADNNDLDKLIATFTARRVVVVIAPRDVTDARFSEPAFRLAYTTWLRAVATRHRDNPYVWYEVAGTVRDCDPPRASWLERAEALLKVVREDAGADNIFVVAGAAHGTDLGCRSRAEPLRVEDSAALTYGARLAAAVSSPANVLFGIAHRCEVEVSAEKLHAYLDAAEARGLAVMFSDLGDGDAGARACLAGLRTVYDVAVARGLGRAGVRYWYNATPGDSWSDVLTRTRNGTTGAAVDDPSAPRNLTPLGELVWADTHRTDGK